MHRRYAKKKKKKAEAANMTLEDVDGTKAALRLH
jgi:hypothetical protein